MFAFQVDTPGDGSGIQSMLHLSFNLSNYNVIQIYEYLKRLAHKTHITSYVVLSHLPHWDSSRYEYRSPYWGRAQPWRLVRSICHGRLPKIMWLRWVWVTPRIYLRRLVLENKIAGFEIVWLEPQHRSNRLHSSYHLCVSWCFWNSTSHLRLGPSASQVLPPHDVISGVVQALALLKNVMTEPWAKQLLGLPPSDVAKPEVPTPSEPPAIATPPVAVPAVPAETAPAVEVKKEVPSVSSPPEKPTDTSTLPEKPSKPTDTGVVNSSTHRAAHARLVRKMDGLTETECPNMQKLWSGTRKDWLAITMLFKNICMLRHHVIYGWCLVSIRFRSPIDVCSKLNWNPWKGETSLTSTVGCQWGEFRGHRIHIENVQEPNRWIGKRPWMPNNFRDEV